MRNRNMERPPAEIATPVADAVAEALEVPVDELPPLSESIDLDGLDAIVTKNPSQDVTVFFTYAGLRVVVHSSNAVYVHPIHEAGIG